MCVVFAEYDFGEERERVGASTMGALDAILAGDLNDEALRCIIEAVTCLYYIGREGDILVKCTFMVEVRRLDVLSVYAKRLQGRLVTNASD